MTSPSSTLHPTFRTNISWHQSHIQAMESGLMFCFNFHGSTFVTPEQQVWKLFVSFSPSAHKEQFPSLGTSTSGYQVMDRDDSFMKWIVGQDFNSWRGKVSCISMIWHQNNSQTPASRGDIFEILVSKADCAEATAKNAGKGPGPALEEILPLCPWFSKSFKLVVRVVSWPW